MGHDARGELGPVITPRLEVPAAFGLSLGSLFGAGDHGGVNDLFRQRRPLANHHVPDRRGNAE